MEEKDSFVRTLTCPPTYIQMEMGGKVMLNKPLIGVLQIKMLIILLPSLLVLPILLNCGMMFIPVLEEQMNKLLMRLLLQDCQL